MKRKGFTLVELMAVIIVLGIIAVIAVPIVLKEVDVSKKEAYEASVKGLFDATNSFIAANDVMGDFTSDGIVFPNDKMIGKLGLKNAKFISGRIYMNEDAVLHVEYLSDGTFCANGTKSKLNIVSGSCDLFDETPPEISIAVGRITSSSISVVVNADDKESGIQAYEYYLDGKLIELVKDNIYTFNSLKDDTEYQIEVRVVNNNGLESRQSVITNTAAKDFIWVQSPSGWSQSKTITLTFPSLYGGELYQYKIAGTNDWVTVSTNTVDITIDQNTTITARVLKEETLMLASTRTFGQIDIEPPVIISVTGNDKEWTTSKKITIEAIDQKSGLADEAYSFDGGKSWQVSDYLTFTENMPVDIWVRDKAGNIAKFEFFEIQYIDPMIPMIHIITATTSGDKNYESDTWTNNTVTLKANPNPSTTPSGYSYQWYKKSGDNFILLKGETKQTLSVDTEETGLYKVAISTGAGAGPLDSDNEYVVKIDKTSPSCEWNGENTEWTKNDVKVTAVCKDNKNGSGCTKENLWTFNTSMKTANLSYIARDTAGNISDCKKNVSIYIDKDTPSIIVNGTTASTKGVGINFNIIDEHSGGDPKSYLCKLGTEEGNYNIIGTINGNSCSSVNLSPNTKYYYQITASDVAGNIGTAVTGSVTTRAFPSITFDVTDASIWTRTKNVTINADKLQGTTLQYMVKDYLTGAIITNWTDITPGTKIPAITAKVRVSARFNDGINTSTAANVAIINIDVTSPSISTVQKSATKNSITLKYKVTDTESGVAINKCCYNSSKVLATSSLPSGEMICIDATSNGCTMTGLKANTKYDFVINVSDNVGNDTIKYDNMTTELEPCSATNTAGCPVRYVCDYSGTYLRKKDETTELDWPNYVTLYGGNKLALLDTNGNFYKVSYEGQVYYIYKDCINANGADCTDICPG